MDWDFSHPRHLSERISWKPLINQKCSRAFQHCLLNLEYMIRFMMAVTILKKNLKAHECIFSATVPNKQGCTCYCLHSFKIPTYNPRTLSQANPPFLPGFASCLVPLNVNILVGVVLIHSAGTAKTLKEINLLKLLTNTHLYFFFNCQSNGHDERSYLLRNLQSRAGRIFLHHQYEMGGNPL